MIVMNARKKRKLGLIVAVDHVGHHQTFQDSIIWRAFFCCAKNDKITIDSLRVDSMDQKNKKILSLKANPIKAY